MTRRRLLGIVSGAVVYLLTYLAAASWAKYCSPDTYVLLKDFVAVALAVPAAVLAGAFQRRNSYLQALRDYWKQLIPAVQAAHQYTYRESATAEEFAVAYVQVSSMVDITRSVFANVNAGRRNSGLYPFENLKDILVILNWLGFGNHFRASEERARARRCITNLWQEMFLALLREFDRDVPQQPVSKYFYTGESIADLLKAGTLTVEHLKSPFRASNPSGRTPRFAACTSDGRLTS